MGTPEAPAVPAVFHAGLQPLNTHCLQEYSSGLDCDIGIDGSGALFKSALLGLLAQVCTAAAAAAAGLAFATAVSPVLPRTAHRSLAGLQFSKWPLCFANPACRLCVPGPQLSPPPPLPRSVRVAPGCARAPGQAVGPGPGHQRQQPWHAQLARPDAAGAGRPGTAPMPAAVLPARCKRTLQPSAYTLTPPPSPPGGLPCPDALAAAAAATGRPAGPPATAAAAGRRRPRLLAAADRRAEPHASAGGAAAPQLHKSIAP